MAKNKINIVFEKGGSGSGHHGHSGRPGKRGGSLPSGSGGGTTLQPSPAPRGKIKPGENHVSAASKIVDDINNEIRSKPSSLTGKRAARVRRSTNDITTVALVGKKAQRQAHATLEKMGMKLWEPSTSGIDREYRDNLDNPKLYATIEGVGPGSPGRMTIQNE